MLTSVILIVLMLLLSAFFSGMEIAFTSKNRLKLEIDRKQSRMFDRIADIFSRHPGQYITTILVGNNIALVIYSLYMSLLLRGIFYALGWESIARNGSVAIETAVSTVIIIFFAEFLPKSVFRNNPNFYYRALAPVIYFFYLLLYPIARLTTLISHGILRLTGRRVEERTTTHSFDREDLASLLDTNSSEPRPEPDNELKLFQNALDFADLRVRDCMVPRVDVEAVDIDDTTIEQLTARFVDSKYSRIFVWRKSIRAAVRLDGNIVVNLRTNIIYADGIRLLMADIDNIRLIVRQRLFTGMTFLTRLGSALFTLQGHGKYSGNKFFAGGFFTVDDISMGNLLRRNGVL